VLEPVVTARRLHGLVGVSRTVIVMVICGLLTACAVTPSAGPAGSGESVTAVPGVAAGTMSCGTKRTCGQMTSCAEARFYLVKCGV
jgi:hypothetical protein